MERNRLDLNGRQLEGAGRDGQLVQIHQSAREFRSLPADGVSARSDEGVVAAGWDKDGRVIGRFHGLEDEAD